MLNKDRILQGTAYKAISSAYKIMKENAIEDSVDNFYNTVSRYSLSEILDNSEFLFSESTKGLDLYKNILESNCVPFYRYPDELEKFSHYVETHKDIISDMKNPSVDYLQITDMGKCESILNLLTEKVNSTKDLYVIETMVITDSKNPSYELESVDLFTDVLYKAKNEKDTDFTTLIEQVGSCLTDHSLILHAAGVSSELGLEPMIMKSIRNVYTENAGIENSCDWKVCLRTNIIMEKMMKNDVIAKNVSMSSNANYDRTFKGIAYESPIEIMGDIILENVDVTPTTEMTAFEAVNELFSRETIENILKEDTEYDEYEILCRKLDVYEAALDLVSMEHTLSNDPDNTPVSSFDFMESFKDHFKLPSDLSVSDAYELLIESCAILEAGKEAYEYTADGRPSKVIAKTAGYDNQDEEFRRTKRQASYSEDEDTEEDGTNNNPESEKTPKHDTDDSMEHIPDKKPKLQKQGLLNRIQNKGLDADAKLTGLKSKSKQLAMNIKNTGKAILKAPSNLIKGWKDQIAKWDEMDDQRRMEFIIKPGFRKHYFKGLRTAILYGGAAYANPMLVPIVWMSRKLSKQKNMRIRNEFTNELVTELKIIDSKIELADKNGDDKEKWRLMRIRDKVDQERIRVTTNSKFV